MADFVHGVEVVEVTSGTRPVQTVRSSVIGIVGTAPNADAGAFPVDTPVLVTTPAEAAKLDPADAGGGTLPEAVASIFAQGVSMLVVVRVTEDVDPAVTQASVIGGVHATTGAYEGMQAFLGAGSALGVEPRILCAPGFSGAVTRDVGQVITGKPVADALVTVAGKLRAIAVIDGPDTTDADATTFAGLFDTARAYIVDPWAKALYAGSEVAVPASAFAAGAIAKSDNDRGFWWSPSNMPLVGVVGTARPVDFKLGAAASRANVLNENDIATIINQNGYRLWGNRVPTTDTKFQFLSVRRTADMLQESLLQGHLWAIDRGITRTYVDDVTEGVRAFIRRLIALEAIIDGDCWADPDLNTPAAIAAGQVYFDFRFTPVYPAERVTFRSHLTDDGLEELFA